MPTLIRTPSHPVDILHSLYYHYCRFFYGAVLQTTSNLAATSVLSRVSTHNSKHNIYQSQQQLPPSQRLPLVSATLSFSSALALLALLTTSLQSDLHQQLPAPTLI